MSDAVCQTLKGGSDIAPSSLAGGHQEPWVSSLMPCLSYQQPPEAAGLKTGRD